MLLEIFKEVKKGKTKYNKQIPTSMGTYSTLSRSSLREGSQKVYDAKMKFP